MNDNAQERIFALLKSIKADFPRRKNAAEALMRQHGLRKPLEIETAAPAVVVAVPTFEAGVSRELSPMLKARFEYAGSWRTGQDTWLSATEMASRVKDDAILVHHRSRREHWDQSAPMTFPDERLALFGLTEGVPEDAACLAWSADSVEPAVWIYEGFDCGVFENLEQYLQWELGRD